MFSLLVKVLVPVASAAAVYIPTKTVTPISSFAGTYSQVSGDCGAQSVVISVDDASSSLLMSSQSSPLISGINQGRQAIQDGSSLSTSDGYGSISNVINDRSSFNTITTTASLKGSTLTITRKIQYGFSRGPSPAAAVCVLQK